MLQHVLMPLWISGQMVLIPPCKQIIESTVYGQHYIITINMGQIKMYSHHEIKQFIITNTRQNNMLSCTVVDMESHGTVQCNIFFLKKENVCKVRVSLLHNSISQEPRNMESGKIIGEKTRFDMNNFFYLFFAKGRDTPALQYR